MNFAEEEKASYVGTLNPVVLDKDNNVVATLNYGFTNPQGDYLEYNEVALIFSEPITTPGTYTAGCENGCGATEIILGEDAEDHMFSDEFDESNYIDGYTLDVDKLVYNEVLIGWPTKILCSEDCKGICNVCGQNLNLGTCDCEDTSLDPRMSVIRDVFKNFKEV